MRGRQGKNGRTHQAKLTEFFPTPTKDVPEPESHTVIDDSPQLQEAIEDSQALLLAPFTTAGSQADLFPIGIELAQQSQIASVFDSHISSLDIDVEPVSGVEPTPSPCLLGTPLSPNREPHTPPVTPRGSDQQSQHVIPTPATTSGQRRVSFVDCSKTRLYDLQSPPCKIREFPETLVPLPKVDDKSSPSPLRQALATGTAAENTGESPVIILGPPPPLKHSQNIFFEDDDGPGLLPPRRDSFTLSSALSAQNLSPQRPSIALEVSVSPPTALPDLKTSPVAQSTASPVGTAESSSPSPTIIRPLIPLTPSLDAFAPAGSHSVAVLEPHVDEQKDPQATVSSPMGPDDTIVPETQGCDTSDVSYFSEPHAGHGESSYPGELCQAPATPTTSETTPPRHSPRSTRGRLAIKRLSSEAQAAVPETPPKKARIEKEKTPRKSPGKREAESKASTLCMFCQIDTADSEGITKLLRQLGHAGDSQLRETLQEQLKDVSVSEKPTSGVYRYFHTNCAIWSPEVYEAEGGSLRNVDAAVRRGSRLACHVCKRNGATLGCGACCKPFHFPCAVVAPDVSLLASKWKMFCGEHS